jgi:hypothetical protein
VLDDSADLMFLLSRGEPCPSTAAIDGVVEDIEGSNVDKGLVPPLRVKNEFRLCCCPQQLFLGVNPVVAWRWAQNDADRKMAVSAAVDRFIQQMAASEPFKRRDFNFGSAFYKSIDTLHLKSEHHSEIIIRACVETIMQQNLRATHAIRVSKSGSSTQLRRNESDRAWRRDVDLHLHLHYWETEKGPEFSKITVDHDDYSIT